MLRSGSVSEREKTISVFPRRLPVPAGNIFGTLSCDGLRSVQKCIFISPETRTVFAVSSPRNGTGSQYCPQENFGTLFAQAFAKSNRYSKVVVRPCAGKRAVPFENLVERMFGECEDWRSTGKYS